MASDLVDVLIPAYNLEAYISESLKSLQRQTHTNFRAIIVVNNSSDRTIELVTDFSKRDSRFQVFDIGKTNDGITGALNFGLTQVDAKYVARFDGDDLMDVQRLEEQLYMVRADMADIVGCNVRYLLPDGTLKNPRISLPQSHKTCRAMFPYRSPVLHLWMTKAEVYHELRGYRSVRYAEDYDFLGRALLRGYRLGNHSSKLQTQRERPGNTASTAYANQVIAQGEVARAFLSGQLESDAIVSEIAAKQSAAKPVEIEPSLNLGLKLIGSAYHRTAYRRGLFAWLVAKLQF